MPNYHFKCLDCGHKFQKLLPVAHQEQLCLECGSEAEKLLTAPGVQFKSGGFYSTDSRISGGGSDSGSSGGVEGAKKESPTPAKE